MSKRVNLLMKKAELKMILATLGEHRQEIKNFGVKKIGVFGSFAKGSQTERSDVDILVKFEAATFDNYVGLKSLLKKLLKKKIDLVTEGSLRPELNYIKKEAAYV